MQIELLNTAHWTTEDYTQRMTEEQWKEILLARADKIVAKGRCRDLMAISLGYGVVEVFKKPLEGRG